MRDDDANIRLVQCLCPARHCITALAFAPAAMDDATAIRRLRAGVEAAIAAGALDPWCALCGSRDWRYEVGRTRFRTMEEARPALEEMEARQAATRAWILGGRRGAPPEDS